MTKEKFFFLSLYLRFTYIFCIFSYNSVHTNLSQIVLVINSKGTRLCQYFK